MKHYLLAALLACAIPTLAQTVPPAGQEASEPTKKDNVIILHTADSVATAYTKLGRLLLESGYPIDKSDKELGYINTGFRATQNRTVEAALRFAVIRTTTGVLIEIRGICRVPTAKSADIPIDFRGTFGSPAGIAWVEMNRLALAYKAPTVTYKQQH
ncbi:hypothetical protein GO988_21520 [Hymenobacter sp. HMF4947]|uniref:Uncharacterized protein n=1 Tax=Hymenobacter ginkgonis TaxID=2682976 RepID=A0A7K1TKH7_9BACT|nr:hypothetical protein [Hymenobacter ginkgonis]MVN78917.1 hypothetical protein [Hymenobacter ginkgonis]